jgi:hypothetical protein
LPPKNGLKLLTGVRGSSNIIGLFFVQRIAGLKQFLGNFSKNLRASLAAAQ